MEINWSEVPEKILQNAAAAISVGIEDLRAGVEDNRRNVAAVRNSFAGLVLIYKAHIARMSVSEKCELLFEKGAQNDRTIKASAIKAIFEKRDVVVDWRCFDRVRNYRNDVEHFYSADNVTSGTVREYVVDVLCLARDFVSTYIRRDPASLFGEKTWSDFLEHNEIVKKVKADRCEKIVKLKWPAEAVARAFMQMTCPYCGCSILSPDASAGEDCARDVDYKCYGCGRTVSYEDVVNAFGDDHFCSIACEVYDGDNEYAIGLGECPECSGLTFSPDLGICLACWHREKVECMRCCETIESSEMDCYNESGLCRRCRNMFDRGD